MSVAVQTQPASIGAKKTSWSGNQPTDKPVSPNGPKRTFKEKLHGMIQEAESSKAQSTAASAVQDVKSLCISMLVEGRPQAFIEFFYLTHRHGATDNSKPANNPSNSDSHDDKDDIPPESIGLLKSQLVRAETCNRENDLEGVYDAYRALAQYFSQIDRPKKAMFFYQRCLQTAKDISWTEGELEANIALGRVYETVHDVNAAVSCHERSLQLALNAQLEVEIQTAYHSLVQVYSQQAERLEQKGSTDDAIACLQKCLEAAQNGQDILAELQVQYRLGVLLQHQEKWQEALDFLARLLELSREVQDRAMEGKALCAVAESHQHMGDTAAAMQSLESFLELSRLEDPHGQAVACSNLGVIYYQQQKYEQAVTYFEKFFEMARTLNDRRMLDTARFNLGVARGALRIDAFMDIVNTDLPALISWKNTRLPFTDL